MRKGILSQAMLLGTTLALMSGTSDYDGAQFLDSREEQYDERIPYNGDILNGLTVGCMIDLHPNELLCLVAPIQQFVKDILLSKSMRKFKAQKIFTLDTAQATLQLILSTSIKKEWRMKHMRIVRIATDEYLLISNYKQLLNNTEFTLK